MPKPSYPTEILGERLPPGQTLSDGFPILHEGRPPSVDLATWDLRIFGEVEEELRLTWSGFQALPKIQLSSDFHCVTGWSKFDNVWEGVRMKEILKHVRLKPTARYCMIYGHLDDDPFGYSTNTSLDWLDDDSVLLATRHNCQDLTPDHGWPVRLVVPKLYAWKSVKWVRGFEFLAEDRRGYWETRGYHNQAEPFAEERYAHQERPKERMHVRGKDYT
jgi:DMSO/TMAO reductase YedYZ molybdopterin-dependent catalytic subunit